MFKWFGRKPAEPTPPPAEAEHPQDKSGQSASVAVQSPDTSSPERSSPAIPPPILPTVDKNAPSEKSGFAALKSAVSVTGKSIVGRIFGLLKDSEITRETLDEIEEILIRADVGLDTATEITDKLRKRKDELGTSEKLMAFLKQEFTDILSPYEAANHLAFSPDKMNIYLVVGVNGAGKTTFIGKLANRYIKQGLNVVIGAGDTFRAAAEEQLEVWAQRSGATFVGAGNTKDPAAVMFEALKQAKEHNANVVLLDTAGRLQNKINLMEELRKVRRVIEQGMPEGAILECLLVLDATTGQNALKQASIFKDAVNLNGVVLTKLDGSAKGGVILTIAKEYELPVKLVGIGEGIDDLKDFNARDFIDALFER